MQNNEDGSVALSKEELAELHKAYQMVVDILDAMPAFLGDYCRNASDYVNIRKWEHLLNGKEFDRSDYVDDDD